MEKVAEKVVGKNARLVLTNQCIVSGVLTRMQPLSNRCTEINIFVREFKNRNYISVILYDSTCCSLKQQNIVLGDTITVIGNIQSSVRKDDPLSQSIIAASIFKCYRSPLETQSLFINNFELFGKLIELRECPWNSIYQLATIATYNEDRMSLVHILISDYIASSKEFHLGEKYRVTGWVRTTKHYPPADAADPKPQVYQHYMAKFVG